jgi:sortase A
MKMIGNILLAAGIILLAIFGYQFYQSEQNEKQSLAQAEERIEQSEGDSSDTVDFAADYGEAFATLEIPKLGKTLPVVEGTDANALSKGIGHLDNSVYPGQDEQIVLSGHRDTVFRNFGNIEIGDQYKLKVPYGTYTYEIRETEIVPEDDTTVIGDMGEEVLVVTTCYPFDYIGNAPDRYVTYAYPVGFEYNN